MKILVIAGLAESLINFRGSLLAALNDRGLQVHVAAPNLPECSAVRQHLQALGYRVHNLSLRRTGTNPLADAFSLCQLWWLMRRVRPSHVLGYTIKPVIYGTLAAWLAGVSHRFVLITGLGYAFQGRPLRRSGLRALVQQLYGLALRRAHKVFFQNPDDQALFRLNGLLPKSTPFCLVNGSGVDLTAFAA